MPYLNIKQRLFLEMCEKRCENSLTLLFVLSFFQVIIVKERLTSRIAFISNGKIFLNPKIFTWNFIIGSTTSPVLPQTGTDMACSRSPLYSPNSSRRAQIDSRTENLCRPAYSGTISFKVPSGLRILMDCKECRVPISKSFGSCAGVIFTAPVPKDGST